MSKRVDQVIEKDETKEKGKDEGYLIYPLSVPIKAYGEEVKSIRMRKPGGTDLLMIGNPVIFSPHVEPPRIEHDFEKVLAMAARLSDPSIPSSSLAELDTQDMIGLAWHLSPFFTPAR